MMEPTIEKYEVRNRFSGEVQFTAEISVTPDMLPSVKLGLAAQWATAQIHTLQTRRCAG